MVDGVSCIHKIIRGTPYDLLLKINGNDRNELKVKVSDICNFKNVNDTKSHNSLSENEKLTYLKLVGQKNM
jgi:hypothetical protein